jgi:hypothetical protein
VEEKLRPRKAHTRALPRRPARAKLRGTAATPCPFRQDASVMATALQTEQRPSLTYLSKLSCACNGGVAVLSSY